MRDMRQGSCALCGRQNVFRTTPYYLDTAPGKSQFRPLRAASGACGALANYVCTDCGYVQTFVDDPQSVAKEETASEVWRVAPEGESAMTFKVILARADNTNAVSACLEQLGMEVSWTKLSSPPTLLCQSVSREQAERIRAAVTATGAAVQIAPDAAAPTHPYRDGAAASAQGQPAEPAIVCERCGQRVPTRNSYITARGQVCHDCFLRHESS